MNNRVNRYLHPVTTKPMGEFPTLASQVKSYILRERRIVYCYNPKTQTSERRPAPSADEQAIDMLSSGPNSAEFVSEYGKLRDSGAEIEQALILEGHEFQSRQPEYQPVLR